MGVLALCCQVAPNVLVTPVALVAPVVFVAMVALMALMSLVAPMVIVAINFCPLPSVRGEGSLVRGPTC